VSSLPKLLITGANGFTGNHACSHFAKAGFKVIAVVRNHAPADLFQTEICDLTNKKAVTEMIKKVKPQYLLHLAGQNHVGESWIDPVSSLEANFLSTLYLIEALRHENPTCKIIVVGSALQFNPQEISTLKHPYSLSKTLQVLIAQSWEKLYKLPIIIAKPSNLIGPGISNGVCSILAKNIIAMEEGRAEKNLEVNNIYAQRDFIDVRDVVNAYETLFKKGCSGEVYDIASGESRSLEEVIRMFNSLTSIKFKLTFQLQDQIEQRVKIENKKLLDLGWTPVISFKTSLTDILNFHRQNKGI